MQCKYTQAVDPVYKEREDEHNTYSLTHMADYHVASKSGGDISDTLDVKNKRE